MARHTIRFSDEQIAQLEAASGGNISDYIRKKLFGEDGGLREALDRIDHLSDDIEDLIRSMPESGGNEGLPLLAEILLILRATVKPETIRKVQAELSRNAITPWSAE
ncbi:hypothetical protein [Halomonas sp. 3A7M]|uniref:hypothetical protein n=1 Tax=Halomonas sp. 3A7M TaxID=2742616 RepID=UPI0018660273|nr:hypothetical protein [Halomonas sp. 3A7M]